MANSKFEYIDSGDDEFLEFAGTDIEGPGRKALVRKVDDHIVEICGLDDGEDAPGFRGRWGWVSKAVQDAYDRGRADAYRELGRLA